MKKLLLGFFFLTLSYLSFGQSKGLNYQAVIMDPKPIEIPGSPMTGQPLKNGKVFMRFCVLSKAGKVDYVEYHNVTTDEFGLINLTIGSGNSESQSGLSTNSTSVTYRTFEAIKWDSELRKLSVDLSFDSGKNFSNVSVQPFNYSAYSLYSEAVDYKNVRESPTELSFFKNDVGFLVPPDLDPVKTKIEQNQREVTSKFLIVNQSLDENSKKINEISTSILSQGDKIEEQSNRINSNHAIVTNEIAKTNVEVLNTKSKIEQEIKY